MIVAAPSTCTVWPFSVSDTSRIVTVTASLKVAPLLFVMSRVPTFVTAPVTVIAPVAPEFKVRF